MMQTQDEATVFARSIEDPAERQIFIDAWNDQNCSLIQGHFPAFDLAALAPDALKAGPEFTHEHDTDVGGSVTLKAPEHFPSPDAVAAVEDKTEGVTLEQVAAVKPKVKTTTKKGA